MTNPTFFTVVADYKSVVVDLASDVDADPTLGPVTAKVTFTPILANGDVILATDASPRPTGYVAAPIVARIDTDGRLKLRVEPDGDRDDFANQAAFPATGNTAKVYWSIADQKFYRWTGSAYAETYPYAAVRLLADTALLELASDLYYRVSFSEVVFNGGPGYIAPFTFQAPSTDTELNLIEVMRQPGQPASGIVKIAPGAVRIDGGDLVFSFAGVDIPDPVPLGTFGATETGVDLLTAVNPAAARAAISAERQRVYNVKDYGATGNGTTDDTTAIHAARTAAGVGGTVVVPPGTYITTGLALNVASQVWQIMPGAMIKSKGTGGLGLHYTINVTAANVTITGGGTVDGNRAFFGNAYPSVMAVIAGSVAASDLTLENITVQNGTYFGVWGQGNRTKVRRCRFTGIFFVPIMLSSYYLAVVLGGTMQETYDMEASDNFVDRSAENPATINSAAIGIKGNNDASGTLHNSYRGKILRNTILMPESPTETTGLTCGIEFSRSQYGDAEGNIIVNGTIGISFARGDYGKAIGNTVIGQTLFGIELANSPGCTVQGNIIDGDGILGGLSSSAGITTQGTGLSTDISIVGNRIFGLTSTGWGISVSAVSRFAIAGNNIQTRLGMVLTSMSDTAVSANSIGGTGDGSGVLLSNCSDITVTGNTVQSMGHGVRIDATSGTSDYINVTGNHFRACTIAVNGTTSGGGALGTNIINAANVVRS